MTISPRTPNTQYAAALLINAVWWLTIGAGRIPTTDDRQAVRLILERKWEL